MEWFENQTFWEKTKPYLFPEKSFESAHVQVDGILSLAGFDSPPRVLDLPCGPGRHTMAFAERGCDVVGVDLQQLYIDDASERLASQNLQADLRVGDMRTFRDENTFDLAVNFFSSFGYFEARSDNLRAARTFAENLRSGGVLILETISLEFICANFQTSNAIEYEDGTLLIEQRQPSTDFRFMETSWTLVFADGERYETGFRMVLYSAAELSELLLESGFSEVVAYGDLEGSAFSPNGRLVLRAVR